MPSPAPTQASRSSGPGYGDDGEAAIDVEWATAAAPNAAIILAACTDTTTTFGGLIALENRSTARRESAFGRQHQLRRSRGRQRSRGERRPTKLHTSRPWPKASRSSSPPATKMPQRRQRQRRDAWHRSQRLRLHALQRRRRWYRFRLLPPTASIPAPTGARPTATPSARHCRTSRRSPGTTRAPGRSLAVSLGSTPRRAVQLTRGYQPERRPALLPERGWRQRRAERMRHRYTPTARASSVEPAPAMPSLRGSQASSAIPATASATSPTFHSSHPTASGTPTTPSAGPTRIRARPSVAATPARAPRHMGGLRRHFRLVADHGRNSGAGKPEDRQPVGKSQHRLLLAGQRRVRRVGQQPLQLQDGEQAFNSCIFYDITQGDNDAAMQSPRGPTPRNCYRP